MTYNLLALFKLPIGIIEVSELSQGYNFQCRWWGVCSLVHQVCIVVVMHNLSHNAMDLLIVA